MKNLIVPIFLFVLVLAGVGFYLFGRSIWAPLEGGESEKESVPVVQLVTGKRTVADVVKEFGPDAEKRLAPYFEKAGVVFPPKRIVLIGLKSEKQLELWAEEDGWKLVRSFEVKAASGKTGPKLAEGDHQVPEGFYRIEAFNPNSSYHLSLKLNYPNDFDLRQAAADRRTKLGGDIFIHGKAVSIGCIAIGDEAIEELFVLVNRIGKENTTVLIVPNDFRIKPPAGETTNPPWLGELYAGLTRELNSFKRH